MSGIPGAVSLWLSGRTVRERRMLSVMAVLIAATMAWLGVVRPVLGWQAAAADRARTSAALLAEVRAAGASFDPVRPAREPPAEGVEPLVRRTAEAAGLQVATSMSPTGHLSFQISGVGAGPLFGWLAALESDHQLTVCALGVIENTDATLNVEGALASDGCSR